MILVFAKLKLQSLVHALLAYYEQGEQAAHVLRSSFQLLHALAQEL